MRLDVSDTNTLQLGIGKGDFFGALEGPSSYIPRTFPASTGKNSWIPILE